MYVMYIFAVHDGTGFHDFLFASTVGVYKYQTRTPGLVPSVENEAQPIT